MLHDLRMWLISLVAIVMFASFVELLLPESSLSKHVKMVLGFVIVLMLVKPLVNFDITKFLEGDTVARLDFLGSTIGGGAPQAEQAMANSWDSIRADGEALARDMAKAAGSNSSQMRLQQLEATLELLAGVGEARVIAETSEDGVISSVAVQITQTSDHGSYELIKDRIGHYVAQSLGIDESIVTIAMNGGSKR